MTSDSLTTAEDTITYRGRVVPSEIVFLNQLIESHDGVGLLRTIDFKEGLVEYWIPRSQQPVFEGILRELREQDLFEVFEQGTWSPENGDIS